MIWLLWLVLIAVNVAMYVDDGSPWNLAGAAFVAGVMASALVRELVGR